MKRHDSQLSIFLDSHIRTFSLYLQVYLHLEETYLTEELI